MKKIQNFTNFRSELVEKQSKLYEFINQKNESTPLIKSEVFDEEYLDQAYVDFPIAELNEAENVQVKTPANDTPCINFCHICMVETHSLRRHVNQKHVHKKNFFCDCCDFGSFFKCKFDDFLLI